MVEKKKEVNGNNSVCDLKERTGDYINSLIFAAQVRIIQNARRVKILSPIFGKTLDYKGTPTAGIASLVGQTIARFSADLSLKEILIDRDVLLHANNIKEYFD